MIGPRRESPMGRSASARGLAGSDRGAISSFILVLLPALVGLAGLAYDGGLLFVARRDAVNIAAAAARAGANDLDEASIYDGDPKLAPTAPGTAQGFAFSQGVASASASSLADDLIEVSVTRTVDLTFLDLFGLGTQTVRGRAEARVQSGGSG